MSKHTNEDVLQLLLFSLHLFGNYPRSQLKDVLSSGTIFEAEQLTGRFIETWNFLDNEINGPDDLFIDSLRKRL